MTLITQTLTTLIREHLPEGFSIYVVKSGLEVVTPKGGFLNGSAFLMDGKSRSIHQVMEAGHCTEGVQAGSAGCWLRLQTRNQLLLR